MIKELYEEYKKALENQHNLKKDFLEESQLSEVDLSKCTFVNGKLVGLRKSWNETIDNFSIKAKEKAEYWWATFDNVENLKDELCSFIGNKIYKVSDHNFIISVNKFEYGDFIEEREEMVD